MNLIMSDAARAELFAYQAQQAEMNNITISALSSRFSVQPAVQQRFENASKESHDFLQKANSIGVTEQKGEKVLLDTTGPVARTNSSYDGTNRRNPLNVVDMKARRYECEQVNYDTFISYPQLDMWAGHPDFQLRVSRQIARQVALDRIMTGFNGTHHAEVSDIKKHPRLEDVNKGWLQDIRDQAPQRVMKDVMLTARNMDNSVAYTGRYANPDALVQDARSSLLDEWHKDADDLVVIMGRNLFNSLRLPVLNSMSMQNPNAELLAGQLIVSTRTIGGLDVYLAPFFPAQSMLITSFSNLSVYWQKGSMRRLMKDEPEYNRIAIYQSVNDCYVVEDHGKCALIENISFAEYDHDAPDWYREDIKALSAQAEDKDAGEEED